MRTDRRGARDSAEESFGRVPTWSFWKCSAAMRIINPRLVSDGATVFSRKACDVSLPIHSMANARVVDIECFSRMKSRKEPTAKIARHMGIPEATARALVQGSHWQQTPELIRLFNAYRGTNIPENGIAPPDVLAQYGGPSGKKRKGSSPGEQATIEMMKRAGVPAELAEQVAARIDANTGNAAPIPERLDTAYFLEMTEQKLARFLRALDDQTIATMTGNDLVKAVSVFIEKRALLRGEPTQIVSHRDRVKLDEVMKLCVEAARKRGITLDLRPNPA